MPQPWLLSAAAFSIASRVISPERKPPTIRLFTVVDLLMRRFKCFACLDIFTGKLKIYIRLQLGRPFNLMSGLGVPIGPGGGGSGGVGVSTLHLTSNH